MSICNTILKTKREHRSIRATVEMRMAYEAKSLCMLCRAKLRKSKQQENETFDDSIVVCFRCYQSQFYRTFLGLARLSQWHHNS